MKKKLASLVTIGGLILVSCTSDQPAKQQADILQQYSESNQGPLRCSPRIFYRDDVVKVTMPVPHPERLAIQDPDGNWFYLQDEPMPDPLIPYDEFKKLEGFELVPASTSATRWVEGTPQRLPVFARTGEYMIYLAQNLETEPENTLFFTSTVFYFNERRDPNR